MPNKFDLIEFYRPKMHPNPVIAIDHDWNLIRLTNRPVFINGHGPHQKTKQPKCSFLGGNCIRKLLWPPTHHINKRAH